MNKREVFEAREMKVVKGNELIQKTRFELSLIEQKCLSYIISLIKPRTPDEIYCNAPLQLQYVFDIKDFCDVTGITYSGTNYDNVKRAIKKLSDRSYWMLTQNDNKTETETLVRWISQSKMIGNSNEKILVVIDEDIAPYMFELREGAVACENHIS